MKTIAEKKNTLEIKEQIKKITEIINQQFIWIRNGELKKMFDSIVLEKIELEILRDSIEKAESHINTKKVLKLYQTLLKLIEERNMKLSTLKKIFKAKTVHETTETQIYNKDGKFVV